MMLLAQTLNDPIHASGWWAWAFGGFAGFIILWQAVQGWQLGLIAKMASFLVLLMAYASGWFFGSAVGQLLSEQLPYPDIALRGIGGALTGITVFFVGGLLVKIFIPHKYKFSSLKAQKLLGLSGLLAGGAIGCLYVLFMLAIINILGNLSEVRLRFEAKAPVANSYKSTSSLETNPTANTENTATDWEALQAPPTLLFAAKLKNSLSDAGFEGTMQTLDPLPESTYRILDKMRAVTQNDRALKSFSNNPLSRRLTQHPDVIALREDPEITQLARARDVDALLRHPKIKAVANNPDLQQMAMEYDIEKALDDSLMPQRY